MLPDGRDAVVMGDERGFRRLLEDGSMTETSTDELRPLRYARSPVSAVGRAPVYVVGVQFPDLQATEPLASVVQRMTETVGAYIDEASRGALHLDFIGLTDEWITACHSQAFYGADGTGVDDRNQAIYELAREAITAVDSFVDFRTLDADGNGLLQMGEAHIAVVHAGNDQASTGRGDDIWSHRWWIYGPSTGGAETRLDGVLISEPNAPGNEASAGYVMVALSDPVGVMVHELLHSFGAPDLYDVSGGNAIAVGPWSVMDIGLWLGSPQGSQPCRPGGYLEWDIDAEPATGVSGWSTPTYLYDGTHTIPTLGTGNGDVQIVMTLVDSEYFLLENRSQTGLDAALSEAGILIYHVDTSQPVNNVESMWPFRVWLEDPGDRSYKRGAAYAEEDGPSQTAFTPATSPSSDSNRGMATGIAITAIGPRSPCMPFRLQGAGLPPEVPHLLSWPEGRLKAGPWPARPGGTLEVILPMPAPPGSRIDLVDMAGRRLAVGSLTAGQSRYSLHVPQGIRSGVFILLYRASDAAHTAPVLVLHPSR
ncbi:M6 family metalloprotease domain-containing protein [Candidatus Fermentibacteria bacterium]|nr:M6 family metalloprotease domain-containing protein [Candidatus Fermentibacteria bacterium]